MYILYLILSCKPFLKTRAQWQRDSWLKGATYQFITGSIESSDKNVVCMNTGDGYETCPERYYQYIRNTELSHDWIVFADDDTFIFPKRLEAYLETLDSSKSIYTGHLLNFPIEFMSGGAGFALSGVAYRALRYYLLMTPREQVEFDINGDVSMGIWLKHIDVKYIHCGYLNGSTHLHPDSCPIEKAISYHYVDEKLFKIYGDLIKD
jgi:hypothetical protein